MISSFVSDISSYLLAAYHLISFKLALVEYDQRPVKHPFAEIAPRINADGPPDFTDRVRLVDVAM